MEMPENFIDWYLKIRIKKIIDHRIDGLHILWHFINVTGLLKTLFSPYRRLTVEKNSAQYGGSGAFDKITFNIISRLIGAGVRTTLIFAGLLFFVAISTLSVFYVSFMIIFFPASISKFQRLQNARLFPKDLKSTELLSSKIQKSRIFKTLATFFDVGFSNVFNIVDTTGIKSGYKIADHLITLSQNWPILKSYLDSKKIKPELFKDLVLTVDSYINFKPATTITPIGQTLAFGYTQTLEKFAKTISGRTFFLTQSERETLEKIEKILTRPQNNNIILVGEPGVGRHETLQNLATAIQTSHFKELSAKQILYLDTTALAGTGKTQAELKSNFDSVLDEAKRAGNIILVVDQIDRITTSKDERLDLSEVLQAAVRERDLPIIGITTPDDFSQYVRPNASFFKFFEKVELEEPSTEGTLIILIGRALNLYKKEKTTSHLDGLLEIVKRSNQLISDKRQPEKSIILFDEAKVEAKMRGVPITVELVDELISKETKTPIGTLTKDESTKLKDLEKILHQRIIGQNEAIEQIAKAMRRARTEIDDSAKPIGSFLFLGPTGVGKTETTKALAQSYFGDENKMVRLDMSEFQGNDAILPRLIGDTTTRTPGVLTAKIRENPYGILLLDEFEKANPLVLNLFLQVLDEGFLTDSFGKKVTFSNTIIIATSNAGSEFIRQQLEKGSSLSEGQGGTLSKDLVNHVLEKGLFTPELINRFDGVIVFHPLTQEEITEVTALMLSSLSKKLKDSKNITLEVTKELAQEVAQKGYNAQFGARPIKRLIQDKIEDEIAKMIIDEKVKNGDTIEASKLLGLI